MNRLQAFEELKKHPMIGKDFRHLSKRDHDACVKFIIDNDQLSTPDFASKTNMWMIGDAVKAKNHAVMWSLVFMANQRAAK